jgi:hypothetical protein
MSVDSPLQRIPLVKDHEDDKFDKLDLGFHVSYAARPVKARMDKSKATRKLSQSFSRPTLKSTWSPHVNTLPWGGNTTRTSGAVLPSDATSTGMVHDLRLALVVMVSVATWTPASVKVKWGCGSYVSTVPLELKSQAKVMSRPSLENEDEPCCHEA